MKLRDKVAVITGGSKGIGFGCARSFTSHGCKVVLGARGVDDGRAAEKELTEQGRQLMRRRRKRVREGYQALFEQLNQTERDSFIGSLRNLDELLAKGSD